MYIVVRGDLSVGEKLAQSNHASFIFSLMYPELTTDWVNESNYIVILEADNEQSLRHLARQAITNYGLKTVMFEEPDMNNSLTAICIEPGNKTKKICSNLKLAM